ncbi:MAG: DUF362 domain-containing protein [Provencibacterium sp.]|jgi:uncharacterized protein (DUF362 family)/ferredoxin|nr:DUF362 domain-containing protein [Provencibacterium sp.]
MSEKKEWEKTVAFTAAGDYRYETILQAVRRQFLLLELGQAVRPGMRVVLKPNLVMRRSPEQATTTHPMLVRCVAEELLALGAGEVILAESPGGPYTRSALEGIYQDCGMQEAAHAAKIRLNDDFESVEIPSRRKKCCQSFNILRPVAKADLVINLPKLKTHCMTVLSAGVKNLFGCVPGLQKPELHYRFPEETAFSEMLVELAETLSPAFTIIDAIESMQGDGPSSGEPYHTGFLAGSRSPFALDAALCPLLGLPEVRMITVARQWGLVPTEEELLLYGDKIGPFAGFKAPCSKSLDFLDRFPAPLRPAVRTAAGALASPRPAINRRRCVGCGKCAQSCPAQIISVREGKARIAGKGCIRCYCCHEMCPVKAVVVRRFWAFRL